MIRRPPRPTRTDTLFPYTTLFRSRQHLRGAGIARGVEGLFELADLPATLREGRAGRRLRHRRRDVPLGRVAARSEEHTSELQSLMRISYAVFCLKKKK